MPGVKSFMPPEKQESSYPRDWLVKGTKDLHRVDVLLADGDTEGAAFHLQQALEKYLKAWLLSKGWKLVRTHDLPTLLNNAIVFDAGLDRFRATLERVTEYFTLARYPFAGDAPPPAGEIRQALDDTRDLVDKITKALE